MKIVAFQQNLKKPGFTTWLQFCFPVLKAGWLSTCAVPWTIFKIRFDMGEACYLLSSTGPSKPQQPLKKAAVDGPSQRGMTNSVSVSESDIEMPFIRLENHWLVHKVCSGVVSTTHQWWSGMGISDFFFFSFFFKAWDANPDDIAIIMGQFTFLTTEHKIAKKSLKLSNMTSIEYSARRHLMFQRRLFSPSYFNLSNDGVFDVPLSF